MEQKFLKHSIDVTILRFYTDVDGAILVKTSGLIPATLKTKFPFYMFGAFDMAGGYKIGLNALPPRSGCVYLMSFVNGAGQSSLSVLGTPSVLNTIQGQLSVGDIVHVFTDSFAAPSCYVWIVQRSQSIPLASIINNTKTTQCDHSIGKMVVSEFGYITENARQWDENIRVVQIDNIGDFQSADYNPAGKWRTPGTGFTGTLNVKIKFEVSQFIELATYMHYNTDAIQFTFIISEQN